MHPVVRQSFTALITLLYSSRLLTSGLSQFVFNAGTSQIKLRQNTATKLVESVQELYILYILRQIKKKTKLFKKAHLQNTEPLMVKQSVMG